MDRGLLLNARTGRPEHGAPSMAAPRPGESPDAWLNRMEMRLRSHAGLPVAEGGSKQGFVEALQVDLADGAQILNTTSETIMVPDYSFAANDTHIYPGAAFRHTIYFDVSNVVTTRGTLTFRVRWGGVAGTVLAASQAITLDTTARANFSGRLETMTVWRTVGATGSAFTQGFVLLNDVANAAAAAPQYFTMGSAGANVPAVVASLDTTTAKLFSTTAQFSVNTATTQLTAHLRSLESLN